MKRVFVLGSLNMDLVIETNTFPRPGETISGLDFFTNPGGKGANQAVASAKQGAKTIMLGAIGDDFFGKKILESVASYGVDCQFIHTKRFSSGIAMITLCDHDNRIITYGGANQAYGVDEAVDDLSHNAKNGDILLIQFEISEATIKAVIPMAHKIGMTVIVNPAPARYVLSPDDLSKIDVLITNELELQTIAGNEAKQCAPEISAQKLIDLGAGFVIVTLGCRGGIYHDGKQIQSFDAVPVTAIDTTAAGDAFVGTIAAELSFGKGIPESIHRAAVCAAITVTRKGAQQAIPTRSEVDCFQS